MTRCSSDCSSCLISWLFVQPAIESVPCMHLRRWSSTSVVGNLMHWRRHSCMQLHGSYWLHTLEFHIGVVFKEGMKRGSLPPLPLLFTCLVQGEQERSWAEFDSMWQSISLFFFLNFLGWWARRAQGTRQKFPTSLPCPLSNLLSSSLFLLFSFSNSP